MATSWKPASIAAFIVDQWTVACPSFMRWEQTYAYHAGWAPPGKGGVSLRLYPDGGYEAILRDRS